MRVLFVTNGYPTDRAPEFCIFNKEQIESLEAEGVHGEVLFINAHENGKTEYLRAIRRIRRRAGDFDLVHCFHGLSFLAATLAGVRPPMVVSFLSVLQNEYRELPRPVARLFAQLTLLALRRRFTGKIFKGGLPEKFRHDALSRHVPNGVDLNQFRPVARAQAIEALGLDERKRYLLFVSSKSLHRWVKRYDRFVEILETLKSDRRFADVEGLTLVRERREKVPYYYGAAAAHVLTSDFEGSPNSVKESLACGVPVVAADVGNVAEMLSGLPGCEVVRPGDTSDYVAALRRVLDTAPANGDYAASYRAALLRRGLDQQTAATRILDLYSAVLDCAGGNSEAVIP